MSSRRCQCCSSRPAAALAARDEPDEENPYRAAAMPRVFVPHRARMALALFEAVTAPHAGDRRGCGRSLARRQRLCFTAAVRMVRLRARRSNNVPSRSTPLCIFRICRRLTCSLLPDYAAMKPALPPRHVSWQLAGACIMPILRRPDATAGANIVRRDRPRDPWPSRQPALDLRPDAA